MFSLGPAECRLLPDVQDLVSRLFFFEALGNLRLRAQIQS